MTIVFKVSDNIKARMIKFYQPFYREKTPPYAIFQAQNADVIITLYESGKVMFQGISADIESSIWIEQEKKLNNRDINPQSKEKKSNKEINKKQFFYENTIGSDEVGTGDYFGPIVVCATYVSKDNIEFLTELGVKDSKKLTDDKIIDIVPKIIERIPYSAFVLTNEMYNKFHDNLNMNKIKAILHNKVLTSLLKKDNYDYQRIVIDQFTPPKNFYDYIKESKEQIKNVTFMTKAEDQVISVAAASVISRYIFLGKIKEIENSLGISIPLGASNLVDEAGVKIVKKFGKEKLNEVAKISFKNTAKIELMCKKS